MQIKKNFEIEKNFEMQIEKNLCKSGLQTRLRN
jgi:hypothetical protein